MNPMTEVWLDLLCDVMKDGRAVAPRGKPTKELPQHTIVVDMRKPVLLDARRKLNYQFMAAEAYWILTGDDRVETIAPWNKNISQYSDDGVKYFGAYGPKILGQMDYVVAKLIEDPDSRQAGLTIWRECPPKTKDVPCTVAMFFSLRERLLEANVFMRSNDVWLGTPYDVFTFSMVAHLVCARLNAAQGNSVAYEWAQPRAPGHEPVSPGALRLTAASSHIYQEHWDAARALAPPGFLGAISPATAPTPEALWRDATALRATLRELRDSKPGHALRWWEVKP